MAGSGSQRPRPSLKDHLKQEFGKWAIRQFDATEAFNAWTILWRAESLAPAKALKTGSIMHLAVLALVAAYGRLFSGDSHLQAKPPWVLPPERAVHDQLMDLRHGSVAHSTAALERVTFFAPGSTVDDQVVSGISSEDWAWQVRALQISAPATDLDAHLRRLHTEIHSRSTAALKRLQGECGGRLPLGPVRLVDL